MVTQTSMLWRPRLPSSRLLILTAMMIMGMTSKHASAETNLRNETDRLALLEFKNQIVNDPQGVLNSWNDSLHHCKWQGITCNARHQRVTAITLQGKSLLGTITPHIGNLSFLRSIELGANTFYDWIPQEIGYLFRLRTLNLTLNQLSGEIPSNLSRCLDLTILDLDQNRLEGKIPTELGSLNKLVRLYLSKNNLTGMVPLTLGNLSSLEGIYLSYNQLEGILPKEMGSLTKLLFLNIANNNINNIYCIYNISSIIRLSVATNALSGYLPSNIGNILPNLRIYFMGQNQFLGNIPISLANASNLERIDLSSNNLGGIVPNNLGNLPNLLWFNIEENFLGSNSSGDLNFITSLSNCTNLQVLSFTINNFGGELPNQVANLSIELTQLFMGSNSIVGKIPFDLGKLANLFVLGLEKNSFSGTFPGDFGKFQNLQGLVIGENQLSGKLPSSFCNISSLIRLDLSGNRFEGSLPTCIGKFQYLMELLISGNNFNGSITPKIFFGSFSSLKDIDLSHNSLTGSLPREIGELVHMNTFRAAYNKFSGEIPASMGDCISLEYLDMQGNLFEGTIPKELTSLKGIQYIDLSLNNLTGKVPKDLEKLPFLKYLNLSFNDLEGEIPTKGVFGNASQIVLDGNGEICGGIPELKLPLCPLQGKKKGKSIVVILLSTIFPVILISVTLASFLYLSYRKRYKKKVLSIEPSMGNDILRVSYHDLHRATTGFSLENLIGSGGFGTVYKGILDGHGDKVVAVKVLDLQKTGASKSFEAECRALRNIRHRNLVSVLTCCSSIDFKGEDFKAIVYEFMDNGSLDVWLHPVVDETVTSTYLNLQQRLNIAVDVASALDYFHNQYDATVILHCDLKPSNVLLDNMFAAHVGDFGLARLLPKTTESSTKEGMSSTISMKGTVGYAAPEYGMGMEASTQGDVYSYGILLLEMFTGKRPTDDIFEFAFNLHDHVKMNLQENVFSIVDPLLISGEEENGKIKQEEIIEGFVCGNKHFEKCLISIFTIGLKCSTTLPRDRMNMNEVIKELHQINDFFFCAQRCERPLV